VPTRSITPAALVRSLHADTYYPETFPAPQVMCDACGSGPKAKVAFDNVTVTTDGDVDISVEKSVTLTGASAIGAEL
jgi:hypothetical protein